MSSVVFWGRGVQAEKSSGRWKVRAGEENRDAGVEGTSKCACGVERSSGKVVCQKEPRRGKVAGKRAA